MAGKVTDPALLAQLNGGPPTQAPVSASPDDQPVPVGPDGVPKAVIHIGPKKVTDPALLQQLNGTPEATDQPSSAEPAAAPSGLFNNATSGVNEAIYRTLGAPVDLVNTSLRAGAAALHAAGGPDIELPVDTAGGHKSIEDAFSSAGVNRPSEVVAASPVEQVARSVGEGAGYAFAPEAGLAALAKAGIVGPAAEALLAQIVGKASSGKEIAANAATGAASTAVGQTAENVAPDNLKPVAALAGGFAGAAAPSTIARTAGNVGRATGSVALDTLVNAKNSAYARADQMGARYSPGGYDRMVNSLVNEASADSISPKRHPKAYSVLDDMLKAPAGHAPSLTQLDQLRQVIRRDVVTAGDDAEAHFGHQMIDGIDNFIEGATPADLVSGSGPAASAAIKAARRANQLYRKVQTIDDLIHKAELQAASTGSGGNINNLLRQGLRRILDSKVRSAGFAPKELAAMEAIVRGSKIENVARQVGKLSPVGNGLMTALGIGAAATNPVLAAAPIAGAISKIIADNITLKKLMVLRDMIAKDGTNSMPLVPRSNVPLVPIAASTAGAEQTPQ